MSTSSTSQPTQPATHQPAAPTTGPAAPPQATAPVPPSRVATPSTISIRLAQSLDILDKQYRLYSWNDAKALSLITTDSVLFAAVGFLFAACLPDVLALLLLGAALILLSLSLFVVLRQVVPQGSSGKSGESANVRSLRGICSFNDWESYRDHFCSFSEEQFAEDAIRQAYGMANNNDKSRSTIRRGVTLTALGIVALVSAAGAAALSARGVHALGSWTPPAVQTQSAPRMEETASGGPTPLTAAPEPVTREDARPSTE